MPLFEVAILEAGKRKEDQELLILGPIAVVAKDAQGAAIAAVIEDAQNKRLLDDIDKSRMEVKVRPF